MRFIVDMLTFLLMAAKVLITPPTKEEGKTGGKK